MKELDDYSFTITNKEGIEVKCDILSLINDNETGQTYIAYTDYILTPSNKFRILISELVKGDKSYTLKEVTDEAKLNELQKTSLSLHEKAFQRIQDKYNEFKK